MSALNRLAWKALYLNLGLTICGLLTIAVCNVLRLYCDLVVYYLLGALWVGGPLFGLTVWGAPAGTFTRSRQVQARRYRHLFFLNLGLVALIFVPGFIAVFF